MAPLSRAETEHEPCRRRGGRAAARPASSHAKSSAPPARPARRTRTITLSSHSRTMSSARAAPAADQAAAPPGCRRGPPWPAPGHTRRITSAAAIAASSACLTWPAPAPRASAPGNSVPRCCGTPYTQRQAQLMQRRPGRCQPDRHASPAPATEHRTPRSRHRPSSPLQRSPNQSPRLPRALPAENQAQPRPSSRTRPAPSPRAGGASCRDPSTTVIPRAFPPSV